MEIPNFRFFEAVEGFDEGHFELVLVGEGVPLFQFAADDDGHFGPLGRVGEFGDEFLGGRVEEGRTLPTAPEAPSMSALRPTWSI